MKSIGQPEAAVLHRAIDEALKAIANRYGLDHIRTGTLTYTPDGLSFSIPIKGKVKVTDENGNLTARAANSSEAYILNSLGCPLNAIASINGKNYRITGYRPKARKNPIDLLDILENKRCAGPVSMVKPGVELYKLRQQSLANRG